MTPQVVLIKLDNGDCGLFVNRKLVFRDPDGGDKFDAMASSLSAALGGNLTVVQAKTPNDPFWLWQEVAGGALDAEQETTKPRALIIVSGGVADYVADDVDVVIFDQDDYSDDPINTELPPAHFADLADTVGVPHKGLQPPKKSVVRAFRR